MQDALYHYEQMHDQRDQDDRDRLVYEYFTIIAWFYGFFGPDWLEALRLFTRMKALEHLVRPEPTHSALDEVVF